MLTEEKHGKKVTICKPRTEASEEPRSDNTLILNFQRQELRENRFLSLSHPVCGVLLQQP